MTYKTGKPENKCSDGNKDKSPVAELDAPERFFHQERTRNRNAPQTIEYVDPKIPTSGCAVRIAKNWGSVINGRGLTS